MNGLGFIPPLGGTLRAYSAVLAAPTAPQRAFNFLTIFPPRRNQGSIGQCAPTTKRGQIYVVTAAKGAPFSASSIWLYYKGRAVRGWENVDSGTIPTDLDAILKTLGCPPESLYPQDEFISHFREKPPESLDAVAERHQALEWMESQTFEEICNAIDRVQPGGIGMTWRSRYDSDGVRIGGILPDQRLEGPSSIRGGHEIVVLGYDRELVAPGWHKPGILWLQQSWGEWGVSLTEFYKDRPDVLTALTPALPAASLRQCFAAPIELVASDDVDYLDALVDVETIK